MSDGDQIPPVPYAHVEGASRLRVIGAGCDGADEADPLVGVAREIKLDWKKIAVELLAHRKGKRLGDRALLANMTGRVLGGLLANSNTNPQVQDNCETLVAFAVGLSRAAMAKIDEAP